MQPLTNGRATNPDRHATRADRKWLFARVPTGRLCQARRAMTAASSAVREHRKLGRQTCAGRHQLNVDGPGHIGRAGHRARSMGNDKPGRSDPGLAFTSSAPQIPSNTALAARKNVDRPASRQMPFPPSRHTIQFHNIYYANPIYALEAPLRPLSNTLNFIPEPFPPDGIGDTTDDHPARYSLWLDSLLRAGRSVRPARPALAASLRNQSRFGTSAGAWAATAPAPASPQPAPPSRSYWPRPRTYRRCNRPPARQS